MSTVSGLFDTLDLDLKTILEVSEVDSCSVLIKKSGEVQKGKTFRRNSGNYHVADNRDGSTLVYALGSQTKVFIALAMSLVFQKFPDGKGNEMWNMKFIDLFNSYSQSYEMRPLPGDPTVKNLLVHRHGVPDINDLTLAPDGTPLLSKQRFVEIVPDVFERARNDKSAPAKYSNANFALLVMLIEAITQCTFEEFLRINVLHPLGMTRTFFGPVTDHETYSEDDTEWALPYIVYGSGEPVQIENRILSSDSVASAVMGMHSCTRDMGILYGSFFDALQGNSRIETFNSALISRLFGFGTERGYLSSISADEDVGYAAFGLFTSSDSSYLGFHSLNRLMLGNDESTSFSLGRGEDFENIKLYSQVGTVTGYSCCTILIPQLYEAVIVMTNTVGLNDAADHVSRLILQTLYGLKIRTRGRFWVPFTRRKKVDMVAKAQRSAVQTRKRWEEMAVRNPPHSKPVRDPDRLVGRYEGQYKAQYLIITAKNNQTFITISDGRFHQSNELVIKSLGPRLFRIIPREPCIDVFGMWEDLTLTDMSLDKADRVTRLSRTVRTAEGENDLHYVYELISPRSGGP